MMPETFKIGVPTGSGNAGTAPGADSNTYLIFDSTKQFPGGLQTFNISRIQLALNNSQSGTLKAYFSEDVGVTWNEYNDQAVTAMSSSASAQPFDYSVDAYTDWKLAWVNGGSAQTTWVIGLKGFSGYHGSAT
jgi:hypothetical protein